MPSDNDYLTYVLDLLRKVDNVTYKKMMGEYILYKDDVIFGGIYDNRFLVKKVPGLEEYGFKEAIPYPTGKPMLLVDLENPYSVADMVDIILDGLKV